MTTATYTKRILRTFELATAQEIEHGVKWYANAAADARAISKAHGVPFNTVVGVISALSPNNRWERNLVDARNLIGAYLSGEDVEAVTVCTYKAMRAKAWQIMEESGASVERIMEILNGQKIKAFAACIMGLDACCIDGHAFNIAMGKRESLTDAKVSVGVKMFRTLQEAYSNAGKRRGFTAYEMQAITWVTWRRLHGIA